MNNRNWALLVLLASFWGTSFLFTAIGLQSLDYLPLVTYRIGFAAIALWIIAMAQSWPIPKGKIWFHFLIVGTLMCSVPFSLIVWGQQYVPSGLAAIFNAGTAIFGAALAPIFFADERLTVNKAIGVLLGFSGIIIAIGVNNLTELSLFNFGQWAIVLATLCYALGGVYGKIFLRASPPKVNALGMISMAAITMLIILIVSGSDRFIPNLNGAIAVAYLSLIGTAAAYMVYYYLLREIGVANVTLVTLIVPIFAIVLGALVLHEQLDWHDYTGFALLALGLLIIDGRIFRRA